MFVSAAAGASRAATPAAGELLGFDVFSVFPFWRSADPKLTMGVSADPKPKLNQPDERGAF